MQFGIQLHVWGDYACFTRPEMKAERVSYDVMTPSAARGILDAIHWKPEIRWVVDRIHVLKPIQFMSFRRNELGDRGVLSTEMAKKAMKTGRTDDLCAYIDEDRVQRATIMLRDVEYLIEAHFVLTGRPEAKNRNRIAAKHISIFNRRAKAGQCFHRPCFGMREMAAHFALAEGEPPASKLLEEDRDRNLGWMFYDWDYENGHAARFFHAQLRGGIVEIPAPRSSEIKS